MQNNEVYRTIESWDPVEGMTGNPLALMIMHQSHQVVIQDLILNFK